MSSSTTPIAGSLLREGSSALPLLAEVVLLIVAIGALLPRFALLAAQETGRDGRFAEDVIAVRGLPDPVLPKLCASLGSYAEASVRDHLCGKTDASPRSESFDRIPPALASASVQATKAFLAPLQDAQTRLADLRRQLREGQDNVLALDDAIESTESEIQPFIKRYSIASASGEGPLPLSCAYERVEAALSGSPARPGGGGDIARANAVILLGAALDGHRMVPSLASIAALPSTRGTLRRACADFETAAALSATSTLMDAARTASMRIKKNEAMMGLLRSAGWQWAAWSIAGLLLLNLSRRAGVASIGVALALLVWAAAAWIGRVPWPFASGRSLALARESAYALTMPANFVLWMLGAAIVVLACTPWLRKALACGPQKAASAFAYPGLVLASGIGFLLVLDLSANGQPANRYLALYHQGHLWFGMLALTVVAFMRQPLGRSLSWMLSLFDGLASNVGKRVGATGGAILFLVAMLVLVGAVGSLLPNSPQLSSEIGRLWLIVGAAWFFFMRGTPFTERLARSGNSLTSLFRYVWPLLFVVIVLIGAMAVTHDMGPLLSSQPRWRCGCTSDWARSAWRTPRRWLFSWGGSS